MAPAPLGTPPKLGPTGPFPVSPMAQVLERRWLHYAFLSRDSALAMVGNLAWLGPDSNEIDDVSHRTSIVLVYHRGEGWRSSQFNAHTLTEAWSAFRLPHPHNEHRPFRLSSTSSTPFVDLKLQRSARACTSQCAPFGSGEYLRWQSEPGVIARGAWGFEDRIFENVEAVGYHERVRGKWSWPALGGWVFGFANDPTADRDAPPPTAVVFTLVQPLLPDDSATGSLMLWRFGRFRRHFPRRCLDIVVRGQLDRDRICQVPALANLFGVPPMAPIPRRLLIVARMGEDEVLVDFCGESAARVIIPNEIGISPFSVHEVIGPCRVEGRCGSATFAFETYGIVEFAGGAGGA